MEKQSQTAAQAGTDRQHTGQPDREKRGCQGATETALRGSVPVQGAPVEGLLLARSAWVGVLLFVGYYLLPLDKTEDIGPLLLIGGLILIGVVIARQVRGILNAPFPRLCGFQSLISGIPSG